MKTASILHLKPKALQRGLKTNLDYQPKSYVRHAGEPKPVSRVEFAGYCHA